MTTVTLNYTATKDAEKTYKIGDWFEVDGQLSILTMVGEYKVCLIGIKSGNRWSDPVYCKDLFKISFRTVCSLTENSVKPVENIEITVN